MASSCAANPASCLGKQNQAQITVTAISVADPKQTHSTVFMISSNISFALALGTDAVTMKSICNPYVYSTTDATFITEITSDPCGFAAKAPAPTLAVGFTAAFAESNPQGFGTVTGLTWTPAGSFGTASGTQSTFTAPQTVPNGGSVTIAAYAIADFTVAKTFPMPIVASKLVPDNIVPPFTLTIPAGQSSGSILLDFLGPTSGSISFTCPPSGFVNLTQSTCAFSPNPGSATGTTTFMLTLNVTRSASMPYRPPMVPLPSLPGLPVEVLSILLLFFLILAFATRKWTRMHWAPAPRWSSVFALLVLCALVLTWVGACGQFSQPGTLPQPPIPPTQPATGSATVTGTPTSNASPSTDSLPVPATVK
jgi:hypothetical protein